jgi:recombination protein RecA
LPTAHNLRKQLESSLGTRNPEALSPRLHVEPVQVPCGLAAFDGLLDGGLAVGVITELVGVECSGRTTMAMAYVAAIIRAGSVCAWVDIADGFTPESAAANGIDLERLLWVRCGPRSTTARLKTAAPEGSADCLNPPVPLASAKPQHTGGGSPHPRSEGRDMPEAIGMVLRAHGGLYDKHTRREKKAIGTPGMPNRPLVDRSSTYRSMDREEQVNSDRCPARRGDNLAIAPRCAEPHPRRVASIASREQMPIKRKDDEAPVAATRSPWEAIDQALRAADLLLQGGGFSLIVIDLGGIAPEAAWRIPLATWFRFRAACERNRVSLLLLTQHRCARSSAELVVRLEVGSMEAEGKVMTGVRYSATTERSRSHDSRVVSVRKPPQSEKLGQWKSSAAWVQAQ